MSKNENHYIWSTASQEIYEIWGEVIVGSGEEATVYVGKAYDEHFKIYDTGAGYHVQDLDSKGATFLNGIEMDSGGDQPLNPCDVISLSGEDHYIYFRAEDIVNLTKEKLESGISSELPAEIRTDLLRKSIVFFRMILPELQLSVNRRELEERKFKILDQREDKLKIVQNKNDILDQKKAELESIFNAKLEKLNVKYREVDKLREKVMETFRPHVEKLEDKEKEINAELDKIEVKHFFKVNELQETHNKKEFEEEEDDDDGELKLDL